MKIWLVQRGMMGTDKSGIDSLIQWDYMGIAEFEFGLSTALKKTIALLPQLVKEKATIGKAEMQFLCTKEQLPELKEFWSNHLLRPMTTKPIKELLFYRNSFGTSTNFWWDIDNCWMATTGKIQLVVDALFNVKKKKGW